MLSLRVYHTTSGKCLIAFFSGNLKIIRKMTYFILTTQFEISMSEMAAIALDTVLVLSEMLAKCCLIQVVKLLAPLLWLGLHDGNWNELCYWWLNYLSRAWCHSPNWKDCISRGKCLRLDAKDWDISIQTRLKKYIPFSVLVHTSNQKGMFSKSGQWCYQMKANDKWANHKCLPHLRLK